MGWGDLGKAKEVTLPGRGPFSVPAEARDVTLLPGLPSLTSPFSLSGASRPRVLVRSSPDNHSGLPKLSTPDLGRVPQ